MAGNTVGPLARALADAHDNGGAIKALRAHGAPVGVGLDDVAGMARFVRELAEHDGFHNTAELVAEVLAQGMALQRLADFHAGHAYGQAHWHERERRRGDSDRPTPTEGEPAG